MIYFNLALHSPFSNKFKLIACKHFSVSKNKTVELAAYRSNALLGFEFYISNFKHDHAGCRLSVQIAGYDVTFEFYDNRHGIDRT